MEMTLQRIVEWCKQRDEVQAVALIGSAASGTEEPPGDWDLTAFCKDLSQYPPAPERQAMWASWLSRFGTSEIRCTGGGADRFVVDDRAVGLDVTLISDVEGRLDQVLSEADVSRTKDSWFIMCECPEAICRDIRTCRSLWDPERLIQRWRTRVADYPEQFKLNVFWWVLLWARVRLHEMRRAVEISDIPLFHMALSDLCFCLFRVLFAVNEEYFNGPKRAFRTAHGFRLTPEGWLPELESVLSAAVTVAALSQLLDRSKRLTQALADLVAAQGEEERKMVERAFFWWPDAEPMVLSTTVQQSPPADTDKPRGGPMKLA